LHFTIKPHIMSKEMFLPAFPTFPVNDQFGTPFIQFGFSKIEYAALMVAGHIAAANPNVLPETVSQEAYEIAVNVLETVKDEYLKVAAAVKDNGSKIIS